MKSTQKGVTLIEVVMVMAIVGILAAVAFPAFEKQSRKGKRAEAKAVLSKIMQAEEQYRTQTGVYTDNPALLPPDLMTEATNTRFYQINGICTPDCSGVLTLTATGINGQEKDDCIVYSLSSTGAKTFTANPGLTAGEVANLKCW